MKNVYIVNGDNLARAIILETADDFDVYANPYGNPNPYDLEFTDKDYRRTIDLRNGKVILTSIENNPQNFPWCDYYETDADGVKHAVCSDEDWVWTEHKEVFDALVKFLNNDEIECHFADMSDDKPGEILINFCKDGEHYCGTISPNHLNPLVGAILEEYDD